MLRYIFTLLHELYNNNNLSDLIWQWNNTLYCFKKYICKLGKNSNKLYNRILWMYGINFIIETQQKI